MGTLDVVRNLFPEEQKTLLMEKILPPIQWRRHCTHLPALITEPFTRAYNLARLKERSASGARLRLVSSLVFYGNELV